ncbi:MAG: hypothetical protein ABIF12_03230 [bacterium]
MKITNFFLFLLFCYFTNAFTMQNPKNEGLLMSFEEVEPLIDLSKSKSDLEELTEVFEKEALKNKKTSAILKELEGIF